VSCHPQHLRGSELPGRTRTGLKFGTAEIVVLVFGAESHIECIRQHDAILHKGAVQLVGCIVRVQIENALADIAIVGGAVIHAPQQLMAPGDYKLMLEIDIEGIEAIPKARIVATCVVVIGAQDEVGVGIELMLPAAENIAAADFGLQIPSGAVAVENDNSGYETTYGAAIDIALHRHAVGVRRTPIGAKAGMPQVPVIIAGRNRA